MEDQLLNVLFSNNSECCACGFFTLLILSSILMPLLGSSQYNLSMLIVCNSWSINVCLLWTCSSKFWRLLLNLL